VVLLSLDKRRQKVFRLLKWMTKLRRLTMRKNKQVIAVAVMAIWVGFTNAEVDINSSGVGNTDAAAVCVLSGKVVNFDTGNSALFSSYIFPWQRCTH